MTAQSVFLFYVLPLWVCAVAGMIVNVRWMRTMMNWQKAQDQQIKRIFLKTIQKEMGVQP